MTETHTPGSGQFECDEEGLVIERLPNGQVSFDIFDASEWPGDRAEGLTYAKLIVRAVNSHAALAEDEAVVECVARAIYDSALEGCGVPGWLTEAASYQKTYLDLARAALLALKKMGDDQQ